MIWKIYPRNILAQCVLILLPLSLIWRISLASENNRSNQNISFPYRSEYLQSLTKLFELGYLSFADPDNYYPGKFNIHETAGSPSRRLIKYGIILASEGLLFAFDRNINTLSQDSDLHGKIANRFFREIEHLGRGGPYAIAIPLFAGYGIAFKNRKSLVVAGETVVSYGAAQWVTYAIKKAFGRKRPYESNSPYHFFKGGSSFYSGHTVSVFTLASVISLNYPRQNLEFIGIHHEIALVPLISYSLAGMVGIQRLYSDNHWASDVFAGAIAGYSYAWLSVHFGHKYFLESTNSLSDGIPLMCLRVRF